MTVRELIDELELVSDKSLPIIVEDSEKNCHEYKNVWASRQTFINKDALNVFRCVLLKCGQYEQ